MVAHEVQTLFQFSRRAQGLAPHDPPPLTSPQGFLYVFGGMLDSAYSNSRYPLWVFDTGERLRGDEGETCRCTPA